MHVRLGLLVVCLIFATGVLAQEQQAGNEASTNADKTFQKLVDACDNTDVLVQRAKIRLQLGRSTDEARDAAQALLDQGLRQCSEGDVSSALASLEESFSIAEAGVTEKFGQDASAAAAVAPAAAAQPSPTDTSENVETEKPWWKFW